MNLLKNKNFLRATAALVGTMVGVGIFGIPFAFSKAGFWTGFLFLILIAAITLLADLMYGEVVLRTRAKHQLVGYTQFYLGPFFKKALFFTAALSTYSALLAYIIISGDFMNNVFSWVFYVSPESYSIIFFVVLSLLILRGLKTVSWAELLLTALFFAVVLGIFFLSLDKLNFSNFKGGALEFWFLPYGILLFAFAGLPAVPLQREILGSGSERLFKKSIFAAVILAAALYFVFAFTVLGISGDTTTPDAISGLFGPLGGAIVFLGSVFGLLEIFHLDFKLSKTASWFLTVLPPFVLFLGGMRTFIDVVSLAGSVGIGLEGAILVFLFMKAKSKGDREPEYSLRVPKWLLFGLIGMFIAGSVYAIFIK